MSAAAQTATPSPYLRLQTNIPETIELAFAKGLQVTSPKTNEDQVLFTLTDGRKWYVKPYEAEMVYDAGVSARTPFEVCKREVVRGNKRTVELQIRTHNDETAPVAPRKETPAAASSAHNTSAAQPIQEPTVAQSQVTTAPAHPLMTCYHDAIDIAIDAQAYAKDRGLLLSPTFDDVRAIAATIYIQAQGGRR